MGATGAGLRTGPDGYSGNGGPGGKAFGGGAYCGQNGSPLFENCSFTGCSAQAGDAGNGGVAAPATGGHGGAWGDINGVWWNEWKLLWGYFILLRHTGNTAATAEQFIAIRTARRNL